MPDDGAETERRVRLLLEQGHTQSAMNKIDDICIKVKFLHVYRFSFFKKNNVFGIRIVFSLFNTCFRFVCLMHFLKR